MASPNDAERQIIFNSILGMFRRSRNTTNYNAALHEFRQGRWKEKGYVFSSFLALARKARRALESATRLTNENIARFGPGDIPSDVGIGPDRPKYQYSVIIDLIRDGYSDESHRVEIRSDRQLSYAELEVLAVEGIDFTGYSGRNRSFIDVYRRSPGFHTRVTIISVTRR